MKTFTGIIIFLFLLISLQVPSSAPVQARMNSTHRMYFSLPRIPLDKTIISLLEARQWNSALEKLTAVTQNTNSDPALHYYVSYCYYELGKQSFDRNNHAHAAMMFQQALEYSDDVAILHLSLGLSRMKSFEYEAAEHAMTEAVRLDPNSYPAYRNLGEIQYMQNDMESALNSWNRALEIDDSDKMLQKRVTALKKQLELTQHFDIESDYHFNIRFDGDAVPELKHSLPEMLDDIYYRIGDQLNAYPNRQIAVVLLSREDFVDVTQMPEWVSGIFEGQIKVPVGGNTDPSSLKTILTHEYVHAVIFDMMSDRCPLWLNEGLAQYFSEKNADKREKIKNAAAWIRNEAVPDLPNLFSSGIRSNAGQARKAYALALSAVDYLIEAIDLYNLQLILEKMKFGSTFEHALKSVTEYSFSEFQSNWTASVR